jgi:hypothetical protein
VRTLHGLWVLSLCGLPVGGCCQRSASVAAVLLFCWRCASLERRTEEGKDTCCLEYLRAGDNGNGGRLVDVSRTSASESEYVGFSEAMTWRDWCGSEKVVFAMSL